MPQMREFQTFEWDCSLVEFSFDPGAEFKITPDVRNALRECEGTYMPVQPYIKVPKVKLPLTFCDWSVGKSLLDNQVVRPLPSPCLVLHRIIIIYV
jgi:hypothetical protein